ncbi:MAG: hypothetical protein J0M04_14250 [Verrucomicrobia bacterium]|nr:hypothetical protein [Verrucomicrobiota bacterium]
MAALVFAVGAVAGWAIRGPHPATPESASGTAPVRSPNREVRRPGKTVMPEDVRRLLAPIHAARTPEDRLRATIELAQNLPVGELRRWYQSDWFDFNSGMESNVFYKITRARWLAEDPEGLMDWSLFRNSEKTFEVAKRWAEVDPHAALAFLKSRRDPRERGRLLEPIAGPLAKVDPAAVLELATESFTRSPYASNMQASTMLAALADASPAALERELGKLPFPLRKMAIAGLDAALLKRDPAAGIAALRDEPDGLKRFKSALSNNSESLKGLLADPDSLPPGWFAAAASENPYQLVRDDPERWIHEELGVLGFSKQQADNLANQAISLLASKDPERAFELLDDGSLTPAQRMNLIKRATEHLANDDPDDAKRWIARLTDPKEIDAANAALESTRNQNPPKTATPAEWLTQLASRDANWISSYTDPVGKWDRDQITAAMGEFSKLPEETKTACANKLVSHGSDEVPPSLQATAISWMLEHPQPDDSNNTVRPGDALIFASKLASTWCRQDPAAASQWVRSLPAGDARLWAAKNLALQWAEYEPQAARQWAASLPADERSAVIQHLDTGGETGH